MRKVGIMGGTFNPIHNGHLMIAEKAREQFALDEVLFMPCGVPYMKDARDIEAGEIRAEMTALAIQGNPAFTLSRMEIEQGGNTYTYETLETLKQKNPDVVYYFILGADSLFHLEHWASPERLFAACHILAAVRDGRTTAQMEEKIRSLRKHYGASIFLLETETLDISSSDIRRKISAGESIAEDVPGEVAEYIAAHQLYRNRT
ncbi:MAG: nicotinate-nucleotide adenylyltransferase [Clostridiales bacterium]|nr:nicotinate-nucleotide adenylyltransferase [Clostridiales bacterium]